MSAHQAFPLPLNHMDIDVPTRNAHLEGLIQQCGPISKAAQAKNFFSLTFKAVGSQQSTAVCAFCDVSFSCTGASRMVDHLVSCPLACKSVREGFFDVRQQGNKKKRAKIEAVALKEEEVEMEKKDQEIKVQKLKQQGIKAGLQCAETYAADMAIARFFYANAVPFSVAASDPTSYYQQMIKAIQNAPKGYAPPSWHKIAGPLLDGCHSDMWRTLNAQDQGGKIKETYGSTYVSDGWDSVDHLPLINSAFITCNDGGTYWRSVDTSGCTKTAEYCACLMIEDIYDFGPTNVVLVVTDTCATMRKAWEIVMDEFPWISVVPCQPHVISLLMKDISSAPKQASLLKSQSVIVNWFTQHQIPLAILRRKTTEILGKSKELLKAGATRFGTHCLVSQRLVELKEPLQQSIFDSEYTKQNYKDTATDSDGRENKGATAKQLILDETGFWNDTVTYKQVMLPIYKFLRRVDTSAPAIGKVYSGWYEIGQHLQKSGPEYQHANAKMAERWEYGHTDFIAAAYVLDPEFNAHSQHEVEEVMDGFMNTTEKLGILKEVRRLQELDHRFTDQWNKRAELLKSDHKKQSTWSEYPKYPTVEDKEVKEFIVRANAQLALYRDRKGVFSRTWVMEASKEMPAGKWWQQYGASVPELQFAATLILSQPASASICERINSEFAFVKDKRRNRLGHDRANKLVSMFHNLRLLARMKKPNYEEPAIAWTEADDSLAKSAVFKYGVATY